MRQGHSRKRGYRRRGRRSRRLFAGVGVVIAAALFAGSPPSLPDAMALPAFPALTRAEPATIESGATHPARTPGRGEFDLHWARTRLAMTPCDDAVAEARRVLTFEPDLVAPTFERVRERCSAAAVNVGTIEPPASANGRVLSLLQEARDACQRSMIEKQMAMEAIERFHADSEPERRRETRLRVDAIERGALNCRATFSAAAEAARLPFADAELAT